MDIELVNTFKKNIIDAHAKELNKIFDLPSSSKLVYNNELKQIDVDGIPVYDVLKDKLFDNEFVSYLGDIRNKKKDRIIQIHSKPFKFSSDEIFHHQFDYDLLSFEHLIDTDLTNKIAENLDCSIDRYYAKNMFLTPASGKTFFEEVYIKELETIGYHLLKKNGLHSEKDFFFGGKGFKYLLKHTITRNNLIDIILDYGLVEKNLEERYNFLLNSNYKFENSSSVYNHIKKLRNQQMKRKATRNLLSSKLSFQEQSYIKFVGDSLDYNEDKAALRSVSLYYAMKDINLKEKFSNFIEM